MSSSDDLPAISFQLHISGGINITGFNITLRNSTLPFDRKFSIIIEEISSAGNRVLSPRFQLSEYTVSGYIVFTVLVNLDPLTQF